MTVGTRDWVIQCMLGEFGRVQEVSCALLDALVEIVEVQQLNTPSPPIDLTQQLPRLIDMVKVLRQGCFGLRRALVPIGVVPARELAIFRLDRPQIGGPFESQSFERVERCLPRHEKWIAGAEAREGGRSECNTYYTLDDAASRGPRARHRKYPVSSGMHPCWTILFLDQRESGSATGPSLA